MAASSKLEILIANLLIPVALVIFSSGFFPYKPFLPGLATFNESSISTRPPAVFDRIIFMVVDALRRFCALTTIDHWKSHINGRLSDFVYSNNSGFLFTQRSVTNSLTEYLITSMSLTVTA